MIFDDIDSDSNIVIRDTIADIVKRRNFCLQKYQEAFDALQEASKAITQVYVATFNHKSQEYVGEIQKLRDRMGLRVSTAGQAGFMNDARRIVDIDAWAYVMEVSNLEKYMDKTAKSQLKQQLIVDPPVCDEETIQLTLQSMALDAGMMFRRGLAQTFSGLDRRFKSHDGWKIGSRVIITNCLSELSTGKWKTRWQYNGGKDFIHDVERVLRHLKGLPPVENRYDGIIAQVEQEMSIHKNTIITEFMKVRGFQNGNVHIWFTDDKLLWKVNQLLAEYYGETLSKDRNADEQYQHIPKMSLVKGLAYFPTPTKLAETIVSNHARLTEYVGNRVQPISKLRVLEPSAGTGAFLNALLLHDPNMDITAIEYDSNRCQELRLIGTNVNVIESDFLKVTPEVLGKFDLIVMNPPFNFGEDITHVTHASKFLKEGGQLIAIMSASTALRSDKNAIHFMKQVTGRKVYDPSEHYRNANFEHLPAGSFSEVGTNVNTILVKVYKELS